jgi:hypothetical protein
MIKSFLEVVKTEGSYLRVVEMDEKIQRFFIPEKEKFERHNHLKYGWLLIILFILNISKLKYKRDAYTTQSIGLL